MNLADEQLKLALSTLLPRDQRILEMRSHGKTFDEIAAAFGFSRAQAFRLAQIARQKLLSRLKAAARAGRHNRADVGEAGRLSEEVKRNADELSRGASLVRNQSNERSNGKK